MRASSGPDPVIAVAYSDVVGPPVEAHRGGIAFLRPSARSLDLVARVQRSAIVADVATRPAFLHGAVGGPHPWVALTDDEWLSDHEPLAVRDATGHRREPLHAREPARVDGGFVALDGRALRAWDDAGAPRWRHELQTAAPASCTGRTPSEKATRHAVSPGGGVVVGARVVSHTATTCFETVVRLARLHADGTPLGPDTVVRLDPPEELWSVAPDPNGYGTTGVDLAARDDGTTLVAVSTWQPRATQYSSQTNVIRLVVVDPDGAVRKLRTIPGTVHALATDGDSWLVLLEPSGTDDSTLLVLAADGHALGDFTIPRRYVAIASLPEGAFVAWRANESDICGMPLGEDGRRGEVLCRTLVSVDPGAGRRER